MRDLPERERDRDMGRLGGISHAARMPVAASAALTGGVAAGLAAGVLFALFEVLAAAVLGPSWSQPFRQFSSVLVGSEALSPAYPLGSAIALGLLVNAVISAFWGVVFAWVASALRLDTAGSMATTGILFGLAVWVFDFYIVTLFARDWFREANVLVQATAHAVFYGLPLGLALTKLWRTE